MGENALRPLRGRNHFLKVPAVAEAERSGRLSSRGSGGEDDAGAGEIVGVEFELNLVAGSKADEVEAMLSGGAGDAAMSVGQFDAIGTVFENFEYRAPCRDLVGIAHGANLERSAWNLEARSSAFYAFISWFEWRPFPAGR